MEALDQLWSRLPAESRPQDAAALERALRDRLAAARARWPKVTLPEADFWRHLAARAPADLSSLPQLHLEDLYLACACAQGDRAAHAALESELLAQVPRWLKDFDQVSAGDVQQDLRQRLLLGPSAHLLQYKGTGPLE